MDYEGLKKGTKTFEKEAEVGKFSKLQGLWLVNQQFDLLPVFKMQLHDNLQSIITNIDETAF